MRFFSHPNDNQTNSTRSNLIITALAAASLAAVGYAFFKMDESSIQTNRIGSYHTHPKKKVTFHKLNLAQTKFVTPNKKKTLKLTNSLYKAIATNIDELFTPCQMTNRKGEKKSITLSDIPCVKNIIKYTVDEITNYVMNFYYKKENSDLTEKESFDLFKEHIKKEITNYNTTHDDQEVIDLLKKSTQSLSTNNTNDSFSILDEEQIAKFIQITLDVLSTDTIQNSIRKFNIKK